LTPHLRIWQKVFDYTLCGESPEIQKEMLSFFSSESVEMQGTNHKLIKGGIPLDMKSAKLIFKASFDVDLRGKGKKPRNGRLKGDKP